MDGESDPNTARVPKAGRRQGRWGSATEEGGETDSQGPPGSGASARPDSGSRGRASTGFVDSEPNNPAGEASDGHTRGWGENVVSNGDDDKKFVGISRRKAQQMEEEAERDKTSGMRNRRKHDADEDGPETILEIPELEAEGEEDITFQVAEAPRARNNRMQTMAELDNDQQYNLPSNRDVDIDLSLLTSVLCSSEQVEEEDRIWEPEILFTDVASELTIEAETLENESAEETFHNT